MSLNEPKKFTNKDIALVCGVCNKTFSGDNEFCPFCTKKEEGRLKKELELKEKEEKRLQELNKKEEEKKTVSTLTIYEVDEPHKIASQLQEMIEKYYKGIKATIIATENGKRCLVLKAIGRSCFPFIDTNLEKKYFLDVEKDVKDMKKLFLEDIKKYGEQAIKGISLVNISQLEYLLSSVYRAIEADKFFESSWGKGFAKYSIIALTACASILATSFAIYNEYHAETKK